MLSYVYSCFHILSVSCLFLQVHMGSMGPGPRAGGSLGRSGSSVGRVSQVGGSVGHARQAAGSEKNYFQLTRIRETKRIWN